MTFLSSRLFMAALLVALTGCATQHPMALQDDKQVVNESAKPIYLMSVTMKNTYRTSYQPWLMTANLTRQGSGDKAEPHNFKLDDKARNESFALPDGNTYLLRMELAPGQYDFVGLTSMGSSLFIHGFFSTPLHQPLTAAAGGVYYLGHVDATVRERQGNEFRAGPVIPLLDQSVAGASGGTFDVEISDGFATDEAVFRSKFSALAHIEIHRAVLPPFDRAKAQKLWEAQ